MRGSEQLSVNSYQSGGEPLLLNSQVTNLYQLSDRGGKSIIEVLAFLKYRISKNLLITVYCSLLTVYCSLITDNCSAQTSAKYLVTLKDKNNSPYSTARPLEFLSQRSVNRRTKQKIAITTRDLPVNPAYINEIKKTGANVWFSSRWMNAVLVQTSATNIQNILKLSFVKGLEHGGPIDSPTNRTGRVRSKFETNETTSFDYGSAKVQNEMIGAIAMHDLGYKGEGMLIGVMDEGFVNVNTIEAFKPIFDEKRIVGTYDFVNKGTQVYDAGSHGTNVLSCMGAFLPGRMVGTAPKASYLLLKTEDSGSESLLEEANWLFGAEYADSVGVDLINASVGYNIGMNDSKMNHTYAQMDGNTTIAARAADWAAATGIICVVSAGNEGNDAWKYVVTPADADSVLAVGAVNANKIYASFSSQGNPTDKRIKPDVVAMGASAVVITPSGSVSTSNGTSFSSPILCGMVAGYWQANPTLTAMEVMANVRKGGSQADKPDRILGYGIPVLFKAPLAIEAEDSQFFKVYPNPSSNTLTIELLQANLKNYEANLTDITGRTIWSEPLKNAIQTISVEKMASGLYFLRVGNEEKSSVVKVVKE
jgi:serine protease AprX